MLSILLYAWAAIAFTARADTSCTPSICDLNCDADARVMQRDTHSFLCDMHAERGWHGVDDDQWLKLLADVCAATPLEPGGPHLAAILGVGEKDLPEMPPMDAGDAAARAATWCNSR